MFIRYGATGAGKTYTMLGTVENPGVMVLAIEDLFAKVREKRLDGNHTVHLSYLEVYNETVRDLLSPGRPLILREDKQGIMAAGLTQYRAYSTDEVMALLQRWKHNVYAQIGCVKILSLGCFDLYFMSSGLLTYNIYT
ncbi:hypothetical protein Bca52824_020867 [Brassica carinata]|uniref:Kinesin motor domain-containing protein n=1 Tax=Brassica carinata TaxID=52824 RepID=A0A8X7VVS6_BRACI|nr:hypothetical protein Bca52824_020867 [Brassica carinata]